MFKKIILTFLLFGLLTAYSSNSYAADDEPTYTQFRVIDAGTFNEFRYKIADEFFNFRSKYELNGTIDSTSAAKILDLATKGYKYLPDSLSNKNYYNYLKTAIERGVKYPNNSSNYTSIISSIEDYLDKTTINSIKGSVDAFPKEGNAPLNVTLRGNVKDPTGTQIPKYNYIWWMYEDGKRKVLGDNISLNHVFREEGNFSIFLDVKSAHKNAGGYTDVLSFSSRADITIKEKIASVIIKVNSTDLRNSDELKFTPDEASYGLLFDATSSTPTSGSKFVKTTWDFGNGIEKSYSGDPKVERVIYAKEGEYQVSLKLQTNELKIIERKFQISVHDPIATIQTQSEEGYLGDKFTFSAQRTGNDKNLSFAWEIIDLDDDKVVFMKSGTTFTYIFKEKGKYNVKMKVTEPSGQTDIDSKIIYINSREPVADFVTNIPYPNKPNKVFFDATKSFDPDFSDEGKLKYTWLIDGDIAKLDEPNFNGSTGYFTFDSIGQHSVTLEVEDPDKISSLKKNNVDIKSILSVDFFAFPRVAQRENTIRFVSSSPEAKFFEWDFGDGVTKGGKDANISHIYTKSGIFKVTLKVRDADDKVNSFSKNVYIGDSNSPYSFIGITDSAQSDVSFDEKACDGEGAYIVNRVDSVTFSGKESINITGETSGLTYSWKLGNEGYKNTPDFTKKFDELGCFPVKLTVKSDDNGRTHSSTSFVEVRNIKPTLSSLDVRMVDETADPVIVNVSALGARDRDGIIQSYLWYYYTDIDSEPQDFRATKGPNTSFVLPKVTGNYYFVVVMKDNNEDRIDSEEITGSKYFMTLTGDNLNTPLVQLKVNDSTVAIGEEVIFTANVENILGQDLTNKVTYSWDFNGDGFYEKETTKNSVSYKFLSSGESHTKVKAKYKGFSNTKTVTVDVSNVLNPDFGYISIGNKFIFFYNGIGTADTYEWDLGDGTIIKDKKYFIHEYSDSSVSHEIGLKISEGTKVKSIEKKVVKNVKNTILARKDGLVVFTQPELTSENELILENKLDNAFIYLGESKDNIVNYVIDYDIDYDSDLNGGNDDDEDNSKLDSYIDGSIIKIELNENKYQKSRVYIKDSNGNIVDSKDIVIVKNYVDEEEIDVNSIIFVGVSDSVKLKIEKLKNYVDGLPKEHKLKSSMYIQKLQEEWSDDREKTNVILEFEGFISDIAVDNSEEIINLLESLLVEDQNDKSDKAITYNALKNLIPTSIVCKDSETLEEVLCYDKMIAKLDAISNNDNIDENRVLGSEILEVIAVDKVMTVKEKTDFKAILKSFIYGGVVNIPEDEKQEELNPSTGSSSNLVSLIFSVFKWIVIIILVLLGFIVLFYLFYKISNKDKNIGFQDFIIEVTSGEKKNKVKVTESIEDDILAELKEDAKKEELDESQKSDSEEKVPEEKVSEENKELEVDETSQDINTNSSDVPDWLKGSFSEEVKQEAKAEMEEKIEEVPNQEEIKSNDILETTKVEEDYKDSKIEDENVPDWLKGSFSEEVKQEAKAEMEEKIEEVPKQEEVKSKDVLKTTKVEEDSKDSKIEDDNIPDWLKGSFSDDVQKKEVESEKAISDSMNNSKLEKKSSKQEDDNIPDWLKGSFSDDVEKKDSTKSKEKIRSDNLDVNKKTDSKKVFENKNSSKKVSEKKSDGTKKEVPKQKEQTKQKVKNDDIIKNNEQTKNTELWDDGMKVPDWLKSDDEK